MGFHQKRSIQSPAQEQNTLVNSTRVLGGTLRKLVVTGQCGPNSADYNASSIDEELASQHVLISTTGENLGRADR